MDDITQEFKDLIAQYEEGLLTRDEFLNRMLDLAVSKANEL